MSNYIVMEGKLAVEVDGVPILHASRISVRLAQPISKQKSATLVGIARGVPDPSGNMKLIPDKDGRMPNSIDLSLRYQDVTIVIIWGNRRYQVTGVQWTDASADNDPGQASLDDSVGWEGAVLKQLA